MLGEQSLQRVAVERALAPSHRGLFRTLAVPDPEPAAGRNRIRVFTPDLRMAAQRRALMAAELREALQSDQLVLHYQPVLYLPTGEVTGIESSRTAT